MFLIEKEEYTVEVKQKMTLITIKEFLKDGAKIQSNAIRGVAGKYTGRHLETIDILQKQDGSNQWESRIIQTPIDGDVITIAANGTGKQDNPSLLRFQGEETIRTQSKKFGSLNSAKCQIEGTNDLENNEATFILCARAFRNEN